MLPVRATVTNTSRDRAENVEPIAKRGGLSAGEELAAGGACCLLLRIDPARRSPAADATRFPAGSSTASVAGADRSPSPQRSCILYLVIILTISTFWKVTKEQRGSVPSASSGRMTCGGESPSLPSSPSLRASREPSNERCRAEESVPLSLTRAPYQAGYSITLGSKHEAQ
jgi:hypothetical protein